VGETAAPGACKPGEVTLCLIIKIKENNMARCQDIFKEYAKTLLISKPKILIMFETDSSKMR